MDKLKFDKVTLRKFGITMAVAFLVITVIILIRNKHSALPASLISGIFIILAFTVPILLKPVYILWMKLAFVLSWVNTRIILLLMFYLVFTPIGILIKLFGVGLLDRKIEREKGSYWGKIEKKEFKQADYERQF